MPRIGSLGLSRDLWFTVHSACYVPNDEKPGLAGLGHRWNVPTDVESRFLDLDEAHELPRFDGTVPFSPRCIDCTRIAKRAMERRGLTRDQIRRCLEALGAKWIWTDEQKESARRESDHGTIVPDPKGGLTLDSTLRNRERNRKARMLRKERKIAAEARRDEANRVTREQAFQA